MPCISVQKSMVNWEMSMLHNLSACVLLRPECSLIDLGGCEDPLTCR